MEALIVIGFALLGLYVVGMLFILKDKDKYIKDLRNEIKKLESNEYKNSQEYAQHQQKIEELGLVEASANQLFNIKQETMRKLNLPNTFFLDEKIYNVEKSYLLKLALVHDLNNSENIDAIDEKVAILMDYPSDN
ncbi:hypothetical protein [Sulfurimonas sp.]|uniref:hypothetical protein n=1 Tax=Sulfurimonas sp. TaxID=2022749 RepID=UPI001A06D4F8|nr:hypothetical protein [Sulfurimonas sp.]MBE0514947.1 hypothetical protein [Sulfurimonas sp.]